MLRRVTFARNKLRLIPSLAAQPSRLVSIDFRHNEIINIDVQAFFNVPNLIQLDLAHNRLQSLPQMIFSRNQRLATLKLHRNPWHCDCSGIDLDFSSADSYHLKENGSLIVPKSSTVQGFTCTADYSILPSRTFRQVSDAVGQIPRFTYTPKDSSYSYTCIAKNIHGRIEHTAKIYVVSSIPPNIYDAPVKQNVRLGEQVTFTCRARGVPKPEITWFYEGSVIPHIKGRFLSNLKRLVVIQVSDGGDELTISKVTRQDQGIYSCMAGNSVGAMMADAKLTIEGDFENTVDTFIDNATLKTIADQARDNVDRAVDNTRVLLSQERVSDPEDLKKLFRFSIPARAIELSKARDIYEESVRLVHEHIQKGLRLPVNKLTPNVSYEAVLAPSHVQTLMELSGCQTGQFKTACTDMCFHNKYRSYDGQCNNFEHPMWGVSQMPLLRVLPPIYENGFSTPVGWEHGRLYYGYPKPNPREVSRVLVATESITPHSYLSAMVMQWGQFVDHDITHTATALSRQSYASGAICNKTCANLDPCFNIPLPPNDPKLQSGIPTKYPCIEFERSGAVCGSGETSLIFQRVTYRDQMNIITSYLDGSVVYGSTEIQALELRDLFGDHGQLRFDIVSAGQKPYLPFEKDSDMDCKRNFSQENPIRCFLAGDLRANEQLALTAMHTIFLREHNRIAAKLLEMNANWDGETIYQEARKLVGAIIQHITYNEWLPMILGKIGYGEMIGDYGGYNPHTNPSISNAFATAAFRFGHTLINPTLFRLDNNFQMAKDGHIPLHKAFFSPERLLSEGGVDPLIRGLFASPLKLPKSDQLLNMELTEKLFHRFHEIALDLAVMNIQRGRDHGLPGYVEYRRFCNFSIPTTWDDLAADIPDNTVRSKLKALYGDPGELVQYENEGVFTKLQLQQIKKVSLARILCDNGDNIDRVQRNVFFYPGNSTKLYGKCDNIPGIDLNMWMNCCDSSCTVSTTHSRKRRDYRDCQVNGQRRRDGERWSANDENCTVCKCETQIVPEAFYDLRGYIDEYKYDFCSTVRYGVRLMRIVMTNYCSNVCEFSSWFHLYVRLPPFLLYVCGIRTGLVHNNITAWWMSVEKLFVLLQLFLCSTPRPHCACACIRCCIIGI
ncbi:immunoglobulin I-set domain protein [Dictyocaulus viviparus]|uniref:Immunoglobulin I-set domain protein n=1 Tax=Dictyocaulus viviparus TaxID=29172 RepID=A0A0D8Y2S5_DICVI|nr:immunoglobulin I-set domain protein [Dictyocaulus viviparus]